MSENFVVDDSVRILKNLRDTHLDVRVSIATEMREIGSLIALVPGSVIYFNAGINDSSRMYVNDKIFAAGKVVQVGERFGFQIDEVL